MIKKSKALPNKSPETTLAQQCYDTLQDNIIDGIFIPGQKLKVENLKDSLNVGQSPIREALSRLVATGLVDTQDNKGFYVAQISEEDIRDIYKTFTQIETLALTQAIKLGDDNWEAAIVAALHNLFLIETKSDRVDYNVWSKRNYDFHVALISGCNSPTLLKVRSDLYKRFDRYCRMAFNIAKNQLELNYEEHKKLAKAVLERDAKAASKLMDYHINGALEEVIKSFKKNRLL